MSIQFYFRSVAYLPKPNYATRILDEDSTTLKLRRVGLA